MSERRKRRALRTTFALAFMGVAAAGLAGGCDADNSLVGGTCAAGYSQCGHECVDLSSDPLHCGSCDHVCPAGLACDRGTCLTLDGAFPDGSDAPWDVADGTADAWDGSESTDGDASTTRDGSDAACIPPYNTDQYCGDCFTFCAPDHTCTPSDGGYACVPRCAAPLSFCAGGCVDEDSSPLHCGFCNHTCLSNICVDGECVGATAGNIVVIGHDYFAPILAAGAQAHVLANAVFLASHNPLRVLSFQHYANASAVTNATTVMTTAAGSLGRTLSITSTNVDGDIPSTLSITNYDVLLVYDQQNAPTGALSALGTSWAPTLTSFIASGGSVVVLDGASGTVHEMNLFTTSAGLLSTTAHTGITPGTAVTNAAPADVIGLGVLSPYGVADHSIHMTTEPAGGSVTYVILDQNPDAGTGSGEPIVVHKTVP